MLTAQQARLFVYNSYINLICLLRDFNKRQRVSPAFEIKQGKERIQPFVKKWKVDLLEDLNRRDTVRRESLDAPNDHLFFQIQVQGT